MIVQGVISGLIAATCLSLCYVFSRVFVTQPGNRTMVLFGLSHAWMGLFAVALLPFCWSAKALDLAAYAWPLLGAVGAYLVGQVFLFRAVRWTDASRVSPMLGLKILILSFIAAFALRERVTPLQWVAVFMSLVAAAVLNYSGGGIPWRAMAAILATCVGYSISDLCIAAMTTELAPGGEFRGILLGCCLSYALAGVLGGALVLSGGREDRTPGKWRAALPVAVTWFAAMVFLYVCFRLLGALFGNIVQAMRGPISVLIGAAVAAWGPARLEEKISRWTLARRIAASLLMIAAIALFVHERAKG